MEGYKIKKNITLFSSGICVGRWESSFVVLVFEKRDSYLNCFIWIGKAPPLCWLF